MIDGHPNYTHLSVSATDGRGLLHRTTEVMKELNVRELMAEGLSASVFEIQDDGGYKLATTVELVESVMGSVKRTRSPNTDEKLKRIADSYRRHGNVNDVARSEGYDPLHVRRLLGTARERGFLEEGE